jgi:hypothetical protein
VIRKDLTAAGGNVPLSQIKDQMKVLNASYSGATGGARTGFTFDLEPVDRTTSAQWFHMTGNGKDKAMKTALKVGGPETLNIYSTDLGNTLLGYAYLAQDAAAVGVLDGVVIHFGSLPGGPFGAHYSQGDTATHEVGHWLDLLHTFQGGCTGPATSSTIRPRKLRPRSSARSDGIHARRRDSTRSRTSWITPTTAAWMSSRPIRSCACSRRGRRTERRSQTSSRGGGGGTSSSSRGKGHPGSDTVP